MRCFAVIIVACGWVSTTAAQPPASADEFLVGDKVWTVRLTVTSKEWKAMEPSGGRRMGPPGPPPMEEEPREKPPADPDRPTKKSPFGYEFPYAHADLSINGVDVKDVGLRYKGNASYSASRGMKRPLKIDFDRWVPGKNFLGISMLSLSSMAMDPSSVREMLAYEIFRAAGVPASRTTFAKIYLTVPSEFDNKYVGLYTVVEAVDKRFLKEHFSNGKGLLLKPERTQGLPYLGEDWSAYPPRYVPHKDANAESARRLIGFTKLINRADDAEFRRGINDFLDVDEFLRLTAANSILGNVDSFFGLGHNYYLYLQPKSNKFVFIPWDLDLSFGGFPMMGTPEQQMDWSIRKPYVGDNKIVRRLLAIPENEAAYRKYLTMLLDGPYQPETLNARIEALRKIIQPALDEEGKTARASVNRGGPPGMRSPELKTFIAKRAESVSNQLAGKSEGQELRGRMPGGPGGPGGGPGMMFAEAILESADTNKDKKISLPEAEAAVKKWFDGINQDKKDAIDARAIAAAIANVLPGPPGGGPGPDGPPGGGRGFNPARGLTDAIVKQIGGAADKPISLDDVLTAARKLFKEWDKNHDGLLDAEELSRGLNSILPRPPPRPPMDDR